MWTSSVWASDRRRPVSWLRFRGRSSMATGPRRWRVLPPPATAGFLATLSRQIVNGDGSPAVESPSTPGLPLQVVCYERADDIGFGVSGVVTRARGIRATLPDLDPSQIPMAAAVRQEKVVYLLDPAGASPRAPPLKWGGRALRLLGLGTED